MKYGPTSLLPSPMELSLHPSTLDFPSIYPLFPRMLSSRETVVTRITHRPPQVGEWWYWDEEDSFNLIRVQVLDHITDGYIIWAGFDWGYQSVHTNELVAPAPKKRWYFLWIT